MAGVDFFLKIDGVEGESQDKTHKKEIEIQSWSFGETNAGSMASGSGGGSGKVQMQDFHFVMPTQKASGPLFQKCATGEHIKKAVLTCRKAGKEQQEYLIWTFEDMLVTSFQTGGSAGSSVLPTDQISLNFTKVECEYKEQKADGSLGGGVKKGYDIKKQEAS